MNIDEYKTKKFDKLTRDVVMMVNKVPTFGYGDAIDAMANIVLVNYLLAIVKMAEIRENDIEILTQSVADEISVLGVNIVKKINEYKNDIQNVTCDN